jgi:Nucleotide modification associated domain 2
VATRVAVLFSYVVDHDLGFAPNPNSGYCTLVHCKFQGTSRRRNIVELAEPGDWIIGSGGRSKESSGPGSIIYLMRVDEKLLFGEFLTDSRFSGRLDCNDWGWGNTFALISRRYFYFGKRSLKLSRMPTAFVKNLTKTGPGFRRDYPTETLSKLTQWFESNFENGMHGDSCAPLVTATLSQPKRSNS